MPELRASGDLFAAQGRAGFETGIVHGHVTGNVSVGVTAAAELCHGAQIEVGANASAEVEALLAVLLPAIRAEGQAFASAGVGASLQLSPNVFDKIGFTAKAYAQAQASVAGRLAIGLDFHTVATLARDVMSDVGYEIFIAFLNEIIVEAGVWGKASIAAMARGQLEVVGSLSDDDDAGFVITAGGEVGWGGGTGWDFYAGISFKDLKRAFMTSAHIISDEVVALAKERLGPEFSLSIELLDLLLPTSIQASLELGQMTASELIGWAEAGGTSGSPFGASFQRQMQRFIFDKLAEAGVIMLRHYFDNLLFRISEESLDPDQRTAIQQSIEDMIDAFDTNTRPLQALTILAGGSLAIVEAVFPHETRRLARPLTTAWAAAALGESMRSAATHAGIGGSVSVAGIGLISPHVVVELLEQPPQLVLDELSRELQTPVTEMTPAVAVDYLLEVGISSLLGQIVPEAAPLLAQISQSLGQVDLTIGDLVESALRGATGGDLTDTELYQSLRTWMQDSILGVVLGELMPALRDEVDDNDDALLYLDEVVEPTLQMTVSFLLRSMDRIVSVANRPDPEDLFYDTFKTGLSSLAWRVLGRNVIVISDILINHALDAVHGSLSDLADDMAQNSSHPMIDAGTGLLTTVAPEVEVHDATAREAVQDLLVDLTRAGEVAFGPQIWTADRRAQQRALLIRLLNATDGQIDFSNPDAVANFFEGLAECGAIADLDGVEELGGLLLDVALDELAVVFERVLPALSIFWLRLTLPAIDALEEQAHEFIDGLAAQVAELLAELNQLIADVEEFERQLAVASGELADDLRIVSDRLATAEFQDAVVSACRSQGLDNAAATAATVPGFDALPEAAQNAAVATAQTAFLGAFLIIEPLIRLGLPALALTSAGLAEVLSGVAQLPDARRDVANAASEAFRDSLDALGIGWVAELGLDDVVAAAHEVIESSALISDALDAALDHLLDEREAQLNRDTAFADQLAKDEELERARKREEDALGGPLIVRVRSPHQLIGNASKNWLYPREIPVRVEVIGATPSFVHPDSPRRIRLALNGQEVPLLASAWQFSTEVHGMTLEHTLTVANSSLRDGLNALEVSTVNGAGARERTVVNFAVDTSLEALPGEIVVDPAASNFDAAGNDHENLGQEYVTLRNVGGRALELKNWIISDAIGHRYKFDDFELLPNSVVRLHTGSGTNDDDDRYWGRTQAVWNNRGDTVFVVSPGHVLRADYSY